MVNMGRESAKDNDLFFTCSLLSISQEKQKTEEKM